MSGPEVRITLGRSGQVVFKGGKRSIGEGHGSNGDNRLFSANKRNRRHSVKWSPLDKVNGSQIDKRDLRLKLMRKRLSNKNQNVDERGPKDRSKNPLRTSQSQLSSKTYMMADGHEANANNFSRHAIPKEAADELQKVDSLDKFHSYQVLAGSSARNPNQIVEGYSRLPPPRNYDEIQRGPPMKSADVYRGRYFLGDETIDAPRLTGSPHVIMRAASQTGNPVTRVAPRSSIMQLGEEPQTVGGFLHSLGLGKYAVSFQAEEIDMTVLKQMGDKDLREMGIPMGPRKKIILALVARMKRQAL